MGIRQPGHRRSRYLDEKLCFDLWNQTGSVSKAVTRIAELGVRDPESGKAPSRRGVEIAAKRYALRNIEESRQQVIDSGGDWAESWYEYLEWMVSILKNSLGSKERLEILEEVNEFAPTVLDEEELQTLQDYIEQMQAFLRAKKAAKKEPVLA